MEWTLIFDELRDAAIVTTSGMFSPAGNARMVADILGRPQWRPGKRILFDHRKIDFGTAGYPQMLAASGNHRANDSRIGAARAALLMKSLADFGVGRQFQHMVDGVSAEVAVFIDEHAAWTWLMAEPDAR